MLFGAKELKKIMLELWKKVQDVFKSFIKTHEKLPGFSLRKADIILEFFYSPIKLFRSYSIILALIFNIDICHIFRVPVKKYLVLNLEILSSTLTLNSQSNHSKIGKIV